VAESSNTDDPNTVGGFDAERSKNVVYCCTAAHQWSRIFTRNRVGDLEDVIGFPYSVRTKGTLIEIGKSIKRSLRAERLMPSEALLAVAARVMVVAPAYRVSLSKCLN
jgi:hypothetical protein